RRTPWPEQTASLDVARPRSAIRQADRHVDRERVATELEDVGESWDDPQVDDGVVVGQPYGPPASTPVDAGDEGQPRPKSSRHGSSPSMVMLSRRRAFHCARVIMKCSCVSGWSRRSSMLSPFGS